MGLKIFIADQDELWAEKLASALLKLNFEVQTFKNGKDMQLSIAENKVFAVIMNLELEGYNGIQVLKYINYTCPQTKAILIADNELIVSELNLSAELVHRIGALKLFQKPVNQNEIIKIIDEYTDYTKKETNEEASLDEKNNRPLNISDEKFTRIELNPMMKGSILVFDIYIRLGKNKFIKIFLKGERFSEARVSQYFKEKSDYLYFLTQERRQYFQFMNDLATKYVSKNTIKTQVKIDLIKEVSQEYLKEIYSQGLKPSLIEYSKGICENIFSLVKNNQDLYQVLRNYELNDPSEYSHSFVAAFFSVMVIKQLKWQTPRSIETMVIGSLFHDIGLIKIPERIKNKKYSELKGEELLQYQKHCEYGVEMLPQNQLITSQVKQIVAQHHELSDGSGYPKQISDPNIFAMAKVLSLVNYFSETMIDKKLKPIDALKVILKDPEIRIKYNQDILINLAKIFIEPKQASFGGI